MIYAYRIWYNCYNTMEKVKKLIGYLKSGRADEVMLFTEGYNTDHAFLPLEEYERRAEWISKIKPVFERNNLIVSVNILNTIGHVDSFDAIDESLKLNRLTGHNGVQAKACVCPLDANTRSYILGKYRIFAKIRPNIIWIDDDFRWCNHTPVQYGCFCESHIKRFNQTYGYNFNRTSLVSDILKVDYSATNHTKKKWTMFQGDALKRLFLDIARAVHKVSPSSSMGLMLPEFDHICSYSGLNLQDLSRTVSKSGMKMAIRPGKGFWNDLIPSSIIYKVEDVAKRNYTIGKGIKAYSEIENYPYSFYNKSCRIMILEMELDIIAGDDTDFAFNLFDSQGNPLGDRKDWLMTCARVKTRMAKVAELCKYTERKGVVQSFSEIYFSNCIHPGKSFADGFPASADEPILGSLGIAEGLSGTGPYILRDQIVLTMSKKQITYILSKGAIIDGNSAYLLCKKGYGNLLGLQIKKRLLKPVNEYMTVQELNKKYSDYGYSLRRENIRPYLVILRGATRLSRLVDLDGEEIAPGITCFENKYGGRVAVFPYPLSARVVTSLTPLPMSMFDFPSRKALFINLLTWVNKAPLLCRTDAEGKVYTVYRENKNGTQILVGIYNLGYDSLKLVKVFIKRLSGRPYKIYSMDKTGKLVFGKGIKQNKEMVTVKHIYGLDNVILYLVSQSNITISTKSKLSEWR